MATFTTYAEVVGTESAIDRARAEHSGDRLPGRLLQAVLDETGGRYEIVLPIPDQVRQDLRRLATVSGDESIRANAEVTEVAISLEHLRGMDPATTRVAIGHRIDYTLDEAQKLGLRESSHR